jgi:hypothetical protein
MRTPFFLVQSMIAFLGACSGPDRESPGTESPPPAEGTQSSIRDEAPEAPPAGAETFHFDRTAVRRTGSETMTPRRSVTFPHLTGDEPGVPRINGFLRHLALHWPLLPRPGRSSPSQSAAMMREVGNLAATLGPDDWPAMSRLESLDPLVPGGFADEAFHPSHDESSLTIGIRKLDESRITLWVEIFDASGATTRGNEGELTLDLHSGAAIPPR